MDGKKKSKHTPGPWRASGKRIERYRSGTENIRPRWVTLKPTEADALLIAAAPDMLEALRTVRAYLEASGLGDSRLNLHIVDYAIAKAEGKV